MADVRMLLFKCRLRIMGFGRDTMAELDYAQLQQQYGGRYVARRDGEVIANAETYDELSEQLEATAVEWGKLIIEYVEPPQIVCVY